LKAELDAYDKIQDHDKEAAPMVRQARSLIIRKLWKQLTKNKKKRPSKDLPSEESDDDDEDNDGGHHQSNTQKRFKSDKESGKVSDRHCVVTTTHIAPLALTKLLCS
jgi:hypothetical protein